MTNTLAVSQRDDLPREALDEGSAVVFGDFRLADGLLFRGGDAVRLTPKERSLLLHLVEAAGSVVSAEFLLERIRPDEEVGITSLSRCVSTLRGKLGGEVVETHYGRGYRIALPMRPASEPVQRGPGPSTEVSQLLAQARYLVGRRTLNLAIRAAERAVELDPACGEGWALIAEIGVWQAIDRHSQPRAAAELVRHAAARALAIDPADATALGARGWCEAAIDGNPAGLVDCARAVKLEPANWLLRVWHGWCLAAMGRLEHGASEAQAAIRLNPFAPGPRTLLGYLLFCCGRLNDARDAMAEAAEYVHGYPLSLGVTVLVKSWQGEHQDAIETARRACEHTPAARLFLVDVLARASRVEEARREMSAAVDLAGNPIPPSLIAPVLLALEGRESALAALAEAEIQGCPYRGIVRHDPRLATLF